MRRNIALFVLALSSLLLRAEPVPILPTPQDFQWTTGVIRIQPLTPVEFLLPSRPGPKLEIGVQWLESALRDGGVEVEFRRAGLGDGQRPGVVQILLSSLTDWEREGEPRQGDVLAPADRRLLAGAGATGQEYALTVDPDSRRVYLIGAGDQGVLYAAVSLSQLLENLPGEVRIAGCQLRDYPDFEYRMAADWLMNVEIDRWSYDWGDGVNGYLKRARRKLEVALDQKINMVLAHGFGWGTDLFPGFAEMMTELNRYARARGVRLVTGGYGASYGMTYQSGPLYEEAPYLGQAFLNRRSYPDGEIYQCMGFPYQREGGMNPRTTGSCRSNEDLNRLKAAELKNYVEKTEPGGLYIHHEDFGGFEGSRQSWLQRCDECRSRWPSDDLLAADGGAGGLAHGYRQMIEAIQSVGKPQIGYDASQDCTIFLVSPVYWTNATSKADWENVLRLWESIARLLPDSPSIQICFREIYPLKNTARRFIDDFNDSMARASRPFKALMFFAGGANYFYNDYPVVSSPAFNRSFLGAGTIYNGNSGFNQEPLQLINAEYSWNVRSTGFYRDPSKHETADRIRMDLQHNRVWPEAIYGADGLLQRACARLYGEKAAADMVRFFTLHEQAREDETPPRMWPKLYPLTAMWRNLALDQQTWAREITERRLTEFMNRHNLDVGQLHQRLISRWSKWARVTREGQRLVENAIRQTAAGHPSRPDLEHLLGSLQVGEHFADLLVNLHALLGMPAGSKPEGSHKELLAEQATRLESFIRSRFGTQTLDPSGGEIGSWLRALEAVRDIARGSAGVTR